MPKAEVPPTPAGGWPGTLRSNGEPDMRDPLNRAAAGKPGYGGRPYEVRVKHGEAPKSKQPSIAPKPTKPPIAAKPPKPAPPPAAQRHLSSKPQLPHAPLTLPVVVRLPARPEPPWVMALREELDRLAHELELTRQVLADWEAANA